MEISSNALTARFKSLSDEQLIERINSGSLSDMALEIATIELGNRGISPDTDVLEKQENAPSSEFEEETAFSRLVTLVQVPTAFDAHVLRTRLEEEGIEAVVADEHLGNANILLSIYQGGIRVQVPEDSLLKAKAIVDAIAAGAFSLPDSEFDSRPVEDNQTLYRKLLEAYTQDAYYPKVWRNLLTGGGRLAGFNVFAMFFGVTWFFFRKMYRLGVIFFVLELFSFELPQIINAIVGEGYVEPAVLMRQGFIYSFFMVKLPAGLFSNMFYYRKADKAIEEIMLGQESDSLKVAHAKSVGGINFGAAMLITMLNIAGMIFMVVARFN